MSMIYIAFMQYSRMNYAATVSLPKGVIDEVTIRCLKEGVDETLGDFTMSWLYVGDNLTCRLEAYEDAFHVLSKCTDLVLKLGEAVNSNLSPGEFCEILRNMGYTDISDEISIELQ